MDNVLHEMIKSIEQYYAINVSAQLAKCLRIAKTDSNNNWLDILSEGSRCIIDLETTNINMLYNKLQYYPFKKRKEINEVAVCVVEIEKNHHNRYFNELYDFLKKSNIIVLDKEASDIIENSIKSRFATEIRLGSIMLNEKMKGKNKTLLHTYLPVIIGVLGSVLGAIVGAVATLYASGIITWPIK